METILDHSPTSTLVRPPCPPPDSATQLSGLVRRLVETTRLLVLAEQRADAEWLRAEEASALALGVQNRLTVVEGQRDELWRELQAQRAENRRLHAALERCEAPTAELPVLPPADPPTARREAAQAPVEAPPLTPEPREGDP